jgi:hypothetical protein
VCERFPRERLSVVLLDDLRASPGPTYAEVCGFLGVDGGFRPPRLGERFNRFVSFRSMRGAGAPGAGCPRRSASGGWWASSTAVEGEYPPMPEAVAADLRSRFAAGNAALAAWLGRDLSAWS